MSHRALHTRQCPHCGGFGLLKLRRRWWQRLFDLAHQYRCQECGSRLTSRQTLAHRLERGNDQTPPP